MRATRDDSGWNTDEPHPISATANNSTWYVGATDISTSPLNVKHMPTGSRYGSGRLSVTSPTAGCNSDAVSWKVSVMTRSEEHTSELQSHVNLVCRLLLEKKKKKDTCT